MIRAFICGCAGTELDPAERDFMAAQQPWGLILFRRNVATPEQLRSLTAAFRDAVGRPDAPVLVDQEGGRVQRLAPPLWTKYPSAAAYARLHATDPQAALQAARSGGRLIAQDLVEAGISIDCAPVLDLPIKGSSAVVGDRAFGRDPETIVALARAFAEGLLDGGVLPVVKHIPGHGKAKVDSHLELPVVDADRAALARDFAPFKALADLPIAMTAHVTFTAIDSGQPATTSAIVIDRIVRGEIGFRGLLLSDDLSMEALEGSIGERAAAALAAGCDMALHCNGKLDETRAVAAVAPILGGAAERRAMAALARLTPAPARDLTAERQGFLDRMAQAAA
jgi:beta-N-acetylhexosaminidase